CEKHLNELFDHQLTWKRYPLSHRDLDSCTQKAACFLLECFINIYNRITTDSIIGLNSNKPAILSERKKKKKLVNDTNISMLAIGIVANTQHLSLGFSTSQKPNQFVLCDYLLCTKADMHIYTNLLSSNLKILACSHKYHIECLEEIDQKFQENIPEETQENITKEFISETNEDDDNVIIIGSNKDTELNSLLQKLKELQR
ncbi:43767_t:CDS:2, partial [Gigaspora margarita]